MSLEALTAASFTPHQGSRFHIAAADGPAFELTLIEVSERGQPGPGRRPFSLIFRGGPGAPAPQRTHRLEHDELGALEVFLVPIGPDAEGQCYQAVFT